MIYKDVRHLPRIVKVLPPVPRILWMRTYNTYITKGEKEEKAFGLAWRKVKSKYHKDDRGKWVKI